LLCTVAARISASFISPDKMHSSKMFLLLVLLVLPHQSEQFLTMSKPTNNKVGWIYAKYDTSGLCYFKGYTPGGNKVIVQKITPQTAEMEAAMFGGLQSNMGKIVASAGGSEVLMKGLGSIKKLASIAPKLGNALGLFGIGLGIVQAFVDPSPQDILDKANEAIAKLANEMDDRLEEMKGYVDQKTMNIEKDLIDREYKSLFKLWGNCIKEVRKAQVDECQEDAVKDIIASRPKFAIFGDRIINNKELSDYDIKRLELSLITFRDWVAMTLGSLSAITATYANNRYKRLEFRRYAQDLNAEIEFAKKYVQNAVPMIKRMHTDGNYCHDTFKCKTQDIWEGWPGINTFKQVKCTCVYDRAELSSHTCEKKVWIRWDGKENLGSSFYWFNTKLNDWKESGKRVAKRLLDESDYVYKLKKTIENYWDGEVLGLIPSWEGLKVLKPSGDEMESNDGEAMDQQDWMSQRSSNYNRRIQRVREEMAVEKDAKYLPYTEDSREDYQDSSEEFYN